MCRKIRRKVKTFSIRSNWSEGMKIKVKLRKDGDFIYQGIHETTNAQQFGDAFAAIWDVLHARRLQQTTSVGQLMEIITEDVLDDFNGSTIIIERL
jgi:hypothetical protein